MHRSIFQHHFLEREITMKDYTIKGKHSNENPALPPQWNDCKSCGAGITRKTDPSQQCRNCREAHEARAMRHGLEFTKVDGVAGNSQNSYNEGLIDEMIRRRGS